MNIVIELLPATDARHEAAVEALIIDTLRRRIRKAVELMVCQIHGRDPSIRAVGRAGTRFDFHVTGCCTAFVRQVKWQLEEAMPEG